jgi:hypothetical protein
VLKSGSVAGLVDEEWQAWSLFLVRSHSSQPQDSQASLPERILQVSATQSLVPALPLAVNSSRLI